MKLWRRRTLVVPTLFGWVCLLIVACTPVCLWCFQGERFLATTDRVDADVLIVEAWMKDDGADAALAEFSAPGRHYRYIVAAGGLTGERWSRRRWDETEIVEEEFRRRHAPESLLIRARAADVETHRTYAAAVAAREALAARGIRPVGINVLTRGPHARRSRLAFAAAFGPEVPVGVIAWKPPEYRSDQWWKSSGSALDFLKETVGYPYELLINSGRHQPATAPHAASP